MKTSGRARREVHDAIKRLSVSLMVVLLFHGFFVMIVRIKNSNTPLASREEEERLRLWSMSSDDSALTPLARDFLKQVDVLLSVDGSHVPMDFPEGGLGLYHGGSFRDREALKLREGIRLGWDGVTARLDGVLFPVSAANEPERVAVALPSSSDALSLEYDLCVASLWKPLRLGHAQSRDNWKSGALAVRTWKQTERIWVSKYEDSAWSDVPSESLSERIAGLVPRGASSLSSVEPCMIWVDVAVGVSHGARVHLRHGSGDAALDSAVLSWVLGMHRHLGHHHTDVSQARRERVIDYWIEVRP